MAPRGIIAAATASAFGLSLTEAEVAGADQILPIAFVVIFATVVLYGLTATPVARLLGVAGAGAPVILVVGGHTWARSIAEALKAAGGSVRIWTGSHDERVAAREAGLEARPVPLGADVEGLEAELEEVNDALVMTDSDDFNALAAFELRQELGRDRVYRLSPREQARAPVPAHAEGRILFAEDLTYPELSRRIEAGARIVELEGKGTASEQYGDGLRPLFVLASDGSLKVVTAGGSPVVRRDDTYICLSEPASSSN